MARILVTIIFLSSQEMLFTKIQEGDFGFPDGDWDGISEDAKDLISHMLVRDPHKRYAAFEVLQHRWVSKESSKLQLATPKVLLRYTFLIFKRHHNKVVITKKNVLKELSIKVVVSTKLVPL